MILSLIIPVYKNEGSIPSLIAALEELKVNLPELSEVVFVVDGSPDNSYLLLSEKLKSAKFASQLLTLSRNFGSFAAVSAGLAAGRGDYFAVMAADLQEPPELISECYKKLATGEFDVVFGQREGREDPGLSKILSNLYWKLYRRLVNPELPEGGVDIFACTAQVKEQILKLSEGSNSLVGLLFWVGYRRAFISYTRRSREFGKSAWTMRKKISYLLDSFFSFTNLPLRLMTSLGILGVSSSIILAMVVIFAKISGSIPVPGYAATVLTVVFFGGLNSLGLGIIGEYLWRTFQNTQGRPNYLVRKADIFDGAK